MYKSWRKFIVACTVIVGVGLAGGTVYYLTKPKATSGPCTAPDVYGYHTHENIIKEVSCPDKRQKLTIVRYSQYMGGFEYKCHCD